MVPGATQFVRMLSPAHSQARLLVSWFSAPGEEGDAHLEELTKNLIAHTYLEVPTFGGSVDGQIVHGHEAYDRRDEHDAGSS